MQVISAWGEPCPQLETHLGLKRRAGCEEGDAFCLNSGAVEKPATLTVALDPPEEAPVVPG